ncbi:O-methyltransferase family 3 [Penicillium sp. IBT 18751x]|nr:O-methyltransferase family 3 [Penicillium sp. IBT 18751x]
MATFTMRRLRLNTSQVKTLRASSLAEGLPSALGHLFRIAVSFSLLFMDNTILMVAVLLSRLRPADRRQALLNNGQPYPKTMLITGIGTSHGLALARAWKAEGHRVVGADVVELDLPIRSGGSMSRTLVAFYQVPTDHYISKILEIIQREKIDLWVPCSPRITAIEDATARQVVESQTTCKCIAFDADLIACFVRPDSFKHFLVERDLPVLEHFQVQSRDSIHKILHRTPAKSYRLSSGGSEAAVSLPKRTLSRTYSEISEINISKDNPWTLQQQNRLGEFFADLLVIRGHVQAIKVRLADTRSPHWGASRLDEALAAAIHRLMQSFASKGGPRMTGHLSVRLLVDEESDISSVRHTIYIGDCISGAAAFNNLLRNAACPVSGYLAALDSAPTDPPAWKVMATLSPNKPPWLTLLDNNFVAHLLPYSDTVKHAITSLERTLEPFLFWMNPRFSYLDPVPWWWHVHVYQPLREIWILVKQTRAAYLAVYFDN